MKSVVATVALAALASSGCFAHDRLSRMQFELAGELKAGRPEEASRTEAEMLALADRAFGQGSVEWVRARNDIARAYAQWRMADRALAVAEDTVHSLDPADERQAIVPALLNLADIQLYVRQWENGIRTTDRLVEHCRTTPKHIATYEKPFSECHFAYFQIPSQYLGGGDYERFAQEYLNKGGTSTIRDDREGAISELTVLGRAYSRYGAYPKAAWYFQRCVEETRARYEARNAPPAARSVARTSSGDVEVLTIDSAHSFDSQSPRCLEDLIAIRRQTGESDEATRLERWQRELWSHGPDLETSLVESMNKSDRIWHDNYNTTHDANNLAFYYAGKGRTEDAIRVYRHGVALIDEAYAKDGVYAGVYPTGLLIDELMGLGMAYEDSGRAEDAVATYERAVDVTTRELHPRHKWRLESRAGLARSLLRAGRVAASETAWKSYLDLAREARGADHADFAAGLDGLAATLEAAHRPSEAKDLRRRADSIRADYRKRVAAARDLPLPFALRSAPSPAN